MANYEHDYSHQEEDNIDALIAQAIAASDARTVKEWQPKRPTYEQRQGLAPKTNHEFGVIRWTGEGRYYRADVVKTFAREKPAQDWADRQNEQDPSPQYVVRTLRYMMGA